jgi:hypothetical protein
VVSKLYTSNPFISCELCMVHLEYNPRMFMDSFLRNVNISQISRPMNIFPAQ